MVAVLSGLRPTSALGRIMFGRLFGWGATEALAETSFSGSCVGISGCCRVEISCCLAGISGRTVVEPEMPKPGCITVGVILVGAGMFSEVSEVGKCRGNTFGAAGFGPPVGFELLLWGFAPENPCTPDVT